MPKVLSYNFTDFAYSLFERKLALLIALQGENIWKGASAAAASWGDVLRKDVTNWVDNG